MLDDSCPAYEAFQQNLAEAGGMGHRQPDVFVQMKQFDPRPVNVRFGDKRIEELELRGSSRGNQTSRSTSADGLANRGGSLGRRGCAERARIGEYFDHH